MKFQQKYTDKELIQMARGYSDFETLHKENRSLYDTIHRRGLEEKAYAHFPTWGRKIWTLEDAKIAAEDCGMVLKEFRKRYSGAYWACRENGWLDIIFPNRRKNSKAYSFQDFKYSLQHAKSLKSWRKEHRHLSTVAYQMKWFIMEDARLTELAEEKGLDVFNSQYARNIISNCAIINEENIRKKAKLCKERKEFRKTFPKHYQKACNLKILNSVCEHMPPAKSREYRAIYAAEFSDRCVYVGLSYDPEERWIRHMNDKRSAVYKHSKESSLMPLFKLVHDYEKKEIASVLEGVYKEQYANEGWSILNRAKTGGLGASLRKHSESYILKVASSCHSYKEFRMNYGGVYHAARHLGILMKVKEIIEPQIKVTRWIEHPELIEEIASHCKTHHEFYTNYEAAAQAAIDLGIYSRITKHMPPKRIRLYTKKDIYCKINKGTYKTIAVR